MIRVLAKGPVTHGFDISHHQPDFDAAMKKVQDPKFCFLKATEGASFTDPLHRSHCEHAAAKSLLVGSYAFYRPSQDPIAQAKHFAGVVAASGVHHDLPPVMDWEVTDGEPAHTDVLGALTFLNALETLMGRTPMIYAGPYFLRALGMNDHFAKYPLWIAEYSSQPPLIPAPWKDWTMWQTSGKGVDMDVFNGSLDDLHAFAKSK